jgi:hypothetical protein
VSDQPGIHQLTLRKGADLKAIQLWVGPEIPLAKNKVSEASPQTSVHGSRKERVSDVLRSKKLTSSKAFKP